MPAMLEDPTAPPLYRSSGALPFPGPHDPLPPGISSRILHLRDGTTATILPFSSPAAAPAGLLTELSELFNAEILRGDTYPMLDTVPLERFAPYWFGNFAAVVVSGEVQSAAEVGDAEWNERLLGSFYVKPNYPGRSSHVCNGGFLVAEAARGNGVGKAMGGVYVDWAPRLGYSYSVFNLVYETNAASLRIWESLGFERIGRVKGCGALRSYPGKLVDAIVFGRDLVVTEPKPS